jgi:hypothetical protein
LLTAQIEQLTRDNLRLSGSSEDASRELLVLREQLAEAEKIRAEWEHQSREWECNRSEWNTDRAEWDRQRSAWAQQAVEWESRLAEQLRRIEELEAMLAAADKLLNEFRQSHEMSERSQTSTSSSSGTGVDAGRLEEISVSEPCALHTVPDAEMAAHTAEVEVPAWEPETPAEPLPWRSRPPVGEEEPPSEPHCPDNNNANPGAQTDSAAIPIGELGQITAILVVAPFHRQGILDRLREAPANVVY